MLTRQILLRVLRRNDVHARLTSIDGTRKASNHSCSSLGGLSSASFLDSAIVTMPVSLIESAPLTSLASASFFGSFIFATVALTTRAAVMGRFRHVIDKTSIPQKSSPLDSSSFSSWCTLFSAFSILGLVLLYAYLCEHHPLYPHAEKSYDRDHVFFLTSLMVIISAWTLRSNGASSSSHQQQHEDHSSTKTLKRVVSHVEENNDVLNRHQTEEWKGWMQTMFLLYHYFHGVELYNSIRVMITCYVWMTGFGNFSFFYTRRDYSLIRVLQMLWRLNFLVIFLCLTQGTSYILYYICLLHTYFFLVVYCTMRIANNATNYSMWGIRCKLGVLAVIIFLVWDVESGLFSLLHGMFMGTQPKVGAQSGTLWEWYFRSSLDHWSTLWGMIFALNYPVTSLLFRKTESLPLWKHIAVKGVFTVALLGALVWWILGPFRLEKYAYNHTHAYYGIIPMMAYIFFRNLTPWLRSHSLDLLEQLGKTTLETYLMQHHIWMTSNSKTLLTLIPGYPKMNFLVVTLVYVLLSRLLFRLTMVLRGMLLPNDLRVSLRNLSVLVSSFGACYVVVVFLKEAKMLSLTTVGLISVAGGSLLYSITMQLSWSSFAEGAASSVPKSGRVMETYVPTNILAGVLVLVTLGSSWDWMARNGGAKLQPLPSTCATAVQKGSWIPVDLCSEDIRGQSSRSYGITELATCMPQSRTYVWGWEAATPSSLCRMTQRSSRETLDSLAHRTVTFVGDSILRHLYHSTCRQVGDKVAGAYNTTMGKWGNFSRRYGTLDLEFRWAPYTNDTLVPTLRSLFEDEENLPDAVVVGGGAWDQLNRYRNKADHDMLVDGIRGVATEMRRLLESGVAVTWVVPTTINTWGLLTEDKRKYLREDQMVSLRTLYKDNGIHDAASFVIEGASFTKERVADSYDGVHYPLEVYDAGSQVILNSFDWLLPAEEVTVHSSPRLGIMAHPILGLLILAVALVALFSVDAFVGLSYLASMIAPELSPSGMYREAYSLLHQRKNLPSLGTPKKSNGGSHSKWSDDGGEDMMQLMDDLS